MKIIATLISLLAFSYVVNAQKYGYAYAYNEKAKILYVTNEVNLDKYFNCKDGYGYGSSTTIEECLKKHFTNKLTIKEGNKSSEFWIKIRTTKSENNLYQTNDYYTSESEVKEAIEELIVAHKRNEYVVYTVYL